MCYGISDISIGHSGTFFRVVCPKISTSQEKLAPTGLHGLHVFATLLEMHSKIVAVLIKKDNSANFTRYFTDIFAKHYNALMPFVTLASKMPLGCYYALTAWPASSRCCIQCSNLANFLL